MFNSRRLKGIYESKERFYTTIKLSHRTLNETLWVGRRILQSSKFILYAPKRNLYVGREISRKDEIILYFAKNNLRGQKNDFKDRDTYSLTSLPVKIK